MPVGWCRAPDFSLTCIAIKYSWIHVLNIRIPEVQFQAPQWIPPMPAPPAHDLCAPNVNTPLGSIHREPGVAYVHADEGSSASQSLVIRITNAYLAARAQQHNLVGSSLLTSVLTISYDAFRLNLLVLLLTTSCDCRHTVSTAFAA